MSKLSKPQHTWTMSIILDEKTDYVKGLDFLTDLTEEVNKKMKANHIVGIAIPKLMPVRKTKVKNGNKSSHPTSV